MEQLFDILPSEWAERFLETEKERIELHFKDVGKLSLLQSKAGGRGYLPREHGYPVTEEGKPLSLLTQINFSEMPQMENYPEFKHSLFMWIIKMICTDLILKIQRAKKVFECFSLMTWEVRA